MEYIPIPVSHLPVHEHAQKNMFMFGLTLFIHSTPKCFSAGALSAFGMIQEEEKQKFPTVALK